MLDKPYIEQAPDEDAPLDLSIKAEKTPVQENEYVCGACGQTFAVHDRLAKHVASRHRSRTPDTARAYECEICRRKFARSDMLTRHARLHSGVKPYSCSSCGQVFSRSDHLATHQRTHTGEKPYRCPVCPYAACRRDMITRHMRTHSRRPQPAWWFVHVGCIFVYVHKTSNQIKKKLISNIIIFEFKQCWLFKSPILVILNQTAFSMAILYLIKISVVNFSNYFLFMWFKNQITLLRRRSDSGEFIYNFIFANLILF